MSPLAVIGYPLLAVAALNFTLAALLGRDRRSPLGPYAAAIGFVNTVYCAVVGLAYVRASLGWPWQTYYRSAWVGWLGLAPVMQIVLVLRGDEPGARRWGRALYVLWGIILVLCWTTDLVETGAASLVPFVDRAGRLEYPARALGALTLCYALVEMYRVRRASAGRRRQQVGYFLLGLALYAAAGLFLAGILQIGGALRFDPALVSYFSVPWMALTFYAITRHRLFDIRFVVWRAVVALVLVVLLVGIDVLLFVWLAPLVGARAGVALASAGAGIVVFTTPVVRLVRRAAATLFLRRRYDYQDAVKEAAAVFASLLAVDDVLRTLLDVARDTVGSASGVVLVRDAGGFRRAQTYGTGDVPDALAPDGPLLRWLAVRAGSLVRDEQELALAPDTAAGLAAELARFGGEVAVPIRHRGELLAVLVLGGKSDSDAYFQTDLDLLETLASEAAVALTNARLMEELRQAVDARDDFLSVAGHELRTPLAALQLNVQILQRSALDEGRRGPRLAAIAKQVGRLGRLMDELLDVSRIRARRLALEREPTDLAAVVREVADRFADELGRAGSPLELDLTDGVVGSWDRSRIEQVVTNLLSNAIKYGAAKPISVAVERANGRARLTVRDRGIGIEPGDQGRIFDRFERAVSRQHFGGLGLGLWITKQVVEAHGGTIALESALAAGATFVVELPLA